MDLTPEPDYGLLLKQITDTFRQGQGQAARAVNAVLTDVYWQVGRHIVEFEQAGQARAAYGKALLEELARDLSLRHGRGFSRSNLSHMRQFFLRYPIREKASHKLSWSHYVELLKLDDEAALDTPAYEKYPALTQAEIQSLVIDDKWMATLAASVQGELDRVSQSLKGRLREWAERYANPLRQLLGNVAYLSVRIESNLAAMGVAWK